MPHLLIVNQYAPPDPSPTAQLMGEVADAAREAGWTVDYVHSELDYHAKATSRIGRYLRELRSLLSIGWRCLTARRPDVVLSLSSPPCLSVIVGAVTSLRRIPHIHWAMDVYPEIAVALGEISGGRLAGLLSALMRWSYRNARLVVALDADMQAHFLKMGVSTEVVAPWYPMPEIHAPAVEQTELVWLYSGNLGRAHEWKTLLDAQALLEGSGSAARLVFQGDGAGANDAKAYAAALVLKRCEWRLYAQTDELVSSLLKAAVIIATQRPETRGLLWPSKLALATLLPRPVLWVGPVDGAVAHWLTATTDCGIFAPGNAEGVAAFVRDATSNLGKLDAQTLQNSPRDVALEDWVARLDRIA